MTLQKLANYHRALHGEEQFSRSFAFRCPRTPQFLKFCAGSFQSSGDVVMQKNLAEESAFLSPGFYRLSRSAASFRAILRA
jgi:hypothetical protein